MHRFLGRTSGFICLGLAGLWLAAFARPAAAGPYILIEADSGRVLAHFEAGQPWYPASVSKLMTAFVTFRALREGRVKLDTPLTVSELAVAQDPSKMGFPAGTQVSVDHALKMLLVKSANDIAVVLAEGVSGSLPAFIAEMNRTAAELGMTGTHYNNPNGLPDDGQITTARDMAILARAIYREFPEYEMMFRIPALKLGGRILHNHNRLIDHFVGADGMKTGFICASGFNIVASAKRGHKRLIAVVFGGYSGARRNEDVARLLEKGFSPLAPIAAVFRREPSSVELIQNLAVAPVNIQADICGGKGRKHPPSESDIEEDLADIRDSDSKGPRQPLFTDLPPSMDPVPVSVMLSPEAQARMAAEDAKGAKGKKKKKMSPQSNEQTEDKPALAKVAPPRGGPLLPLSAQSGLTPAADASPESTSPNQPAEFTPLKSSQAQFAPLAAPAAAAEPKEPVRRVVAAAAGGEAAPAAAAPEQPVQSSGKSDALPRSAQAFAPDSSIAVAPALRNLPLEAEPLLQLPATTPLPRPRPKF